MGKVRCLLETVLLLGMALPVIAEDRLSLTGEMRVRGWHVNADHDNYYIGEEKVKSPDSTETWADQRLRIGGKISVAEGVSVTFRFDVTESNWGTTGNGNGFGSGRSGSDSSNQWDRAHIDLNRGNFHLRAGQFLQVYSITHAVDVQDNGVMTDYTFGNVPVNVFLMVDDCNEATDSNGETQCKEAQNQDTFVYGARVSPQFYDIALDIYGGGWHGDDGLDVKLAGANLTWNMDAFKLVGTFDYFGGDHSHTEDAMGTQFMVDGSFGFTEQFTFGGQMFYARGDDDDVQYTRIGNGFDGWDPIWDIGTDLNNEEIAHGSPFNIAENSSVTSVVNYDLGSAGVIGGRLYGSLKVSDTLTFGTTVGYFEEENDSLAKIHLTTLAGGLVYELMPNTTFQIQLQYTDGSIDPPDQSKIDFDSFEAGSGLFVNF